MALEPEQHLAWLLEQVRPVPPVTLPVADGFEALHGSVLATDVSSAHPLPLWANSAMDGYAVRAADTASAPVTLEIVGEVAAGSAQDPALAPGQCVRIMTGAPLPTDADAVVRVEDSSGWATDRVTINVPVSEGRDVRARGEDLAAGDPVALAGQPLTAVRLSALAAAGADRLSVRRAPRVAVLVTGSELQTPGAPLRRGHIPESNSLLLAGLLAEAGLHAATVRRCVDDPAAVRAALDELSGSHDAIISTGGVGPGAYDIMGQVLREEPAVRSVRVKIRPGQPQCAGRLASGSMIFALPGNPVSAAVSFELFVRPALRAMQGYAQVTRPRLTAVAAVGWKAPAGRLQVLPVVFDSSEAELWCSPAVQAAAISHSVGGFGAAEGYALVPAGTGPVAPGDTVQVLRLVP